MVKIRRISVGIKGLDEKVEGGLPKDSITVIAGNAGAGKTLFGLSYLYEGAKKKEIGMYLGFEERPEKIISEAEKIGLKDFKKFVNKGLIILNYYPKIESFLRILRDLEKSKREAKINRLVVDSITDLVMGAYTLDNIPIEFFRVLEKGNSSLIDYERISRIWTKNLIDFFRDLKVTTLILSEAPLGDSEYLTTDRTSEFASDGIIVIKSLGLQGTLSRTIWVAKMRQTGIDNKQHFLKISNKGLELKDMGKEY